MGVVRNEVVTKSRANRVPSSVNKLLFDARKRCRRQAGVGRKIWHEEDRAIRIRMPDAQPDALAIERVESIVEILAKDATEVPTNLLATLLFDPPRLSGAMSLIERFREDDTARHARRYLVAVKLPDIPTQFDVVSTEKLKRLQKDSGRNAIGIATKRVGVGSNKPLHRLRAVDCSASRRRPSVSHNDEVQAEEKRKQQRKRPDDRNPMQAIWVSRPWPQQRERKRERTPQQQEHNRDELSIAGLEIPTAMRPVIATAIHHRHCQEDDTAGRHHSMHRRDEERHRVVHGVLVLANPLHQATARRGLSRVLGLLVKS